MVAYERMMTLSKEVITKIQIEWEPKEGDTIFIYDDFTDTSGTYRVLEVNDTDIRIDGEPLLTWIQLNYYRDRIVPLLSEKDFDRFERGE